MSFIKSPIFAFCLLVIVSGGVAVGLDEYSKNIYPVGTIYVPPKRKIEVKPVIQSRPTQIVDTQLKIERCRVNAEISAKEETKEAVINYSHMMIQSNCGQYDDGSIYGKIGALTCFNEYTQKLNNYADYVKESLYKGYYVECINK